VTDNEWLEFEGGSHPADEILGSVCGVCGCWSPWDLERYLRQLLLAPLDGEILHWGASRWNDSYYFAATLLDIAGLVEHGGSIAGSWLTPRGRELRVLVETWTG
jgi:hypothetical protein